jgi:hypothetical protein
VLAKNRQRGHSDIAFRADKRFPEIINCRDELLLALAAMKLDASLLVILGFNEMWHFTPWSYLL